ncbi:superinfection immunity protein [Streptomyces sp. CAU 1734]|uniref:superinfection immunity protein n=1 Tax=Streptomyces sp. CAU 1734 TaxID=3140360 RepID=UPI0032611E6F
MEILLTVVVAIAITVVYLLPTYIAFSRGAKNRWLILVINLVFGASLIGWGVAFFMATRTPKPAARV